MTTCTRCGHTVEVGRFCTNCGAPVGSEPARDPAADPGDTAERPAVRQPPPPLPPAPSAARYPLFADEVEGGSGPEPATRVAAPLISPATSPVASPATGGPPSHRGGGGWLVWVVLAAVLVVVALVGATLLLANDGDGDDERADGPSAATSAAPPASEDAAPGETGSGDQGDPGDVAGAASAQVPATAPQGTDVEGARIRYDAAQMLDGDPQTCWRMTGDGTGDEIVLTLAEPTVVTELGLINGYAKTARDAKGRDLDWYAGNRRILAVEWELDDGTVVEQDLDETRDLQGVRIDPVETSTVVLRLVEVSKPGKGRAARDNTAISELSVVGTTR